MKRFSHIHLFITLFLLVSLLLPMLPLSGAAPTLPDNATPDDQTVDNELFLPVVMNTLPPIIPDTTEVLTEDTTQHLLSVSEDSATFTFAQLTPELDALDAGDVMVGGISDAAPYGFLRQVIDVTITGGQVIVITDAATLEDAIQQGQFSFSKRLTPDDIEGMTLRPGVQLVRPSAASIDDSFFFEINDVVLHDIDGNPSTTYDQFKVNGSLELAPDFSFDWIIEDWTLQELEFIFNAQETAELEFQIEVELLSAELRYELARLHLGTITVFVGPVPVVFLIEMPIYLRADGDVSIGVTTSVIQEADLSAGLRYEQGDWSPITSLTNDFDWELPTLSAGVDLKGYIDPPLGLLLYGVTGPFAGANPYLKLETDIFANPWWELYGGIEATVGVKVEVLGRSLGEHTERVIGYEILLAHAATNQPPNIPSNPSPPDGAQSQSIEADLSWVGGDPDGDAVTYDVYLEIDDPAPDLLVSTGQAGTTFDPGTLLPQSHYYWQVVAQDEQGEVTAGPVWDFTTGSGNPETEIFLTLSPPQVTDLTVTVNGTVTATNSAITRLNWQWGDGSSGDQWFPASHTYAVTGTYPITVTAFDNLGNTAIETTTAYVGMNVGEMVYVPAGEFQMGCHPDHNGGYGCSSDELPLHAVYLDAYYIDRTEVSNAQYAQCVAAGACTALSSSSSRTRTSYYDNPSYANYPIVRATWYQANAYCSWLNKRLPTEAEWEKAARGSGTPYAFPWGDQTPTCQLANFGGSPDPAPNCVGDTLAVNSYADVTSQYGAINMAGNVWEWVQDWYQSDYYAVSPDSNPPGPTTGTLKVLRGGSWWEDTRALRTVGREMRDPAYDSGTYYSFGFRCAFATGE